MKQKTIRNIITKKVDAWIKSIDDLDIQGGLKNNNVIVAGGCITSMFLNEDVNDFDIYIIDGDLAFKLATYYSKKMGLTVYVKDHKDTKRIELQVKGSTTASRKYTDKNIYLPTFISSNAITLTDDIQIITRFYGTPDEIIANYDYVHCTNYWHAKKLHINVDALEATLSKELRYRGSRYPICSIIRMRKFINRGWTINAGQILKMVFQIKELDLNDPEVMFDQLTGVDVAYFSSFISKVKDTENFDSLDSTQLGEMIDIIFDGDDEVEYDNH